MKLRSRLDVQITRNENVFYWFLSHDIFNHEIINPLQKKNKQTNKNLLWQAQKTADHILMRIPFLSANFTQASKTHFKFIIEKDTACLNISSTKKKWNLI